MCGIIFKKKKAIILNDAGEHDDYISYDSKTLSKIIIPISMIDDIVAVIDTDSPVINGFDQIDKSFWGNFYR